MIILHFSTTAVRKKKVLLNESGQAIFEFIIFLPVLLLLYGVIVALSGAINGSINQQKALRGYTFARLKGDSTVPIRVQIETLGDKGAERIGMFNYIWAERITPDKTPVAPCYKIPIFGYNDSEACDDVQEVDDLFSPFVRVKTAFGICGATYGFPEGGSKIYRMPKQSTNPGGCLITTSQ